MAAKVIIFTFILALSAFVTLGGCTGGGKATHKASHQGEAMKSQEEDTQPQDMPKMEQEHSESMKMESSSMGGTMDQVFTAEQLFTCKMHPEVVSANADKPCPICNMNLQNMSDEKVKELRASQLKGCAMDPIVLKSDAELAKCPVCNMELNAISHQGEAHD